MILTNKPIFNKEIMNTTLKSKFIFVLTSLFFLSIPVFSYDADTQKCIEIDAPDKRLRCYDAIFQEKKLTIDSTSLSKIKKLKQ